MTSSRAAHELKTPLTTIAGMAEILRTSEESLGPDEKRRVYGALIRQTARANRLISDLLDLARLESGQVQMEMMKVDLREVVAGSAEASSVGKSVGIENQIDPLLTVTADAFRLEEVFVNLFTNSAKYGASSITVSGSRDRDLVRVVVADDGPGIPDDVLPNLFVPFTRGPRTDAAGSGLGLSITKALCEAMGGDIEYSPQDSGGATFVVTLPTG